MTTPAPADTIRVLDDWFERTADERLADYLALLRLPSIGTLSEHAADVRATAEFIAQRFRSWGLENVEVSPTAGHPIVYADWLHAEGAPTVLVYAHYDVQPVDPLDLWQRPPFDPVVENGRVYARGSADDKAHVHMHLWSARAWLENHGHLPVNLKFVFEGEEESGSDNFDPWIVANQERLAADFAVISDTGFYEGNRPAITIGLRGLVYMQIDVTGSQIDLHSGTFGGNVQNPAIALAQIIARLKNEDGSVAVPGFYDETREISEREHEEFARMPFDPDKFRSDYGLNESFGEPQFLPLERRGARPTLDVNGIWGGFQGEGSKTIIPAHAHAKVSCRLVADMETSRTYERVRDYVAQIAPRGVDVVVRKLNEGNWSLTPMDHPATAAAAECLEEVFGEKPFYLREGGSIPAGATFTRVLGLPVVLLGFIQPDDNAHAPNENMRLDNVEGGLRTIVR
ncbi:MAG TPA: dipeptidase, partial [Candidatus Limnocylindrales bacterium]|nr:dipeptidase [Candidatus Limnocylindrales bacterium]